MRKGLLVAGVSSLMWMPSVAIAQERASDDVKSVAETSQTGNDIVVTATRRSETVQDVPISITVMTGDQIAELGATNTLDYFRQVPNLNLTQGAASQSRIGLRGVQATGDPTVGIYYDETPITGPSGTAADAGFAQADLNLFDVERLEVLRGPQGTLYGSSSMGGTLRVIFNKPNLDKVEIAGEAQVSSTRGGDTGWFVRAMSNIPIVHGKVAVRAVGYYEDRAGYVDNVTLGTKNVNGLVNKGGRIAVKIAPQEEVSLLGTFIYQKQNADDFSGWYEPLGAYRNDAPLKAPFASEFRLYNLVLNWDIGPAILTATGSYYEYDLLRAGNFSGLVGAQAVNPAGCRAYFGLSDACTPTQLAAYRAAGLALLPASSYQPASLEAQNYEARLASTGGGTFQWTVGAYHEARDDEIEAYVVTANAQGDITHPFRPFADRFVKTETRQSAAFGEVSLRPLSALTLTAGLRYYDYSRRTSGQVLVGSPFAGTTAGPLSSARADDNGWLYKANATYAFSPRVMVYATASNGFRPGGANNVPGLSDQLVAYRPDSLWTYEAGFKSQLFDRRVTLNAAIFQTDWRDLQTFARTSNFLYAIIANAGKARIRGGEIELSVSPVRGLSLDGAIGYADAKLTEDQASPAIAASGSTGRAGDRMPFVPKMTGNASVSYGWSLGGALDGLVRADFAYTGSINSAYRPTTDPYFERYGGYSTLNLRAGVRSEFWEAELFANNVGNSKGAVYAGSSIGVERMIYTVPPRTIGLTTRFSF